MTFVKQKFSLERRTFELIKLMADAAKEKVNNDNSLDRLAEMDPYQPIISRKEEKALMKASSILFIFYTDENNPGRHLNPKWSRYHHEFDGGEYKFPSEISATEIYKVQDKIGEVIEYEEKRLDKYCKDRHQFYCNKLRRGEKLTKEERGHLDFLIGSSRY